MNSTSLPLYDDRPLLHLLPSCSTTCLSGSPPSSRQSSLSSGHFSTGSCHQDLDLVETSSLPQVSGTTTLRNESGTWCSPTSSCTRPRLLTPHSVMCTPHRVPPGHHCPLHTTAATLSHATTAAFFFIFYIFYILIYRPTGVAYSGRIALVPGAHPPACLCAPAGSCN